MTLQTLNINGKNYYVLPYHLAETIFAKAQTFLKGEAKIKLSNLALALYRLSCKEEQFTKGFILCPLDVFQWLKTTIDNGAKQEEFVF